MARFDDLVTAARDALGARRVFAEPYVHDGVAIIAAANISGGGGGGGGQDREGKEGGGGFGLQARPAGAYVVKDGSVRWAPAIDVNRVISVVGAVVIALLVTRARGRRLRPDG